MPDVNEIFQTRLKKHHDELKWLYMELYDNDSMFAELCTNMYQFYIDRRQKLKQRDVQRETQPDWFKKNDMLGMMLYIDNFAGNLKGVGEKLSYLKDCHVNCVHLMPFLDSPPAHSDGGYAVSDFRKVRPDLGTMEDLSELAELCHNENMNLCMDFVMNHTSEEHDWAVRARAGEGEYMSRYFFFDNYALPAQYEQTVPQVFPTTAPGNFTWLPEIGHYVMTSFYPYQWDLNYSNPRVFNEMMYNFLYLANQGMDIIRVDAVPYIWKQLGTQCRNLPQVHNLVRMMRMISEIVCPGVALLGEVVMEPEKVAPYFGTTKKPECHMLYNVTTMATLWHTVATRDTRLLKEQMNTVFALPKSYTFLNYIRCHDDIGWGLDYDRLRTWGMEENPHKKYLNNYFQGKTDGSVSRGELYNDDPLTGDARFCATTASMCGIESAVAEQDTTAEQGMIAAAHQAVETSQPTNALMTAITKDIMLHAFILTLSGLPMLYSGDEIGQLNDYTYKNDPKKFDDSRYIHRGKFNWALAEKRKDPDTIQGTLFNALNALTQIRATQAVFSPEADVTVRESGDWSVLWIVRKNGTEELHAIFNFSEGNRTLAMPPRDGCYNLLTGETMTGDKTTPLEINLSGWGFVWLI